MSDPLDGEVKPLLSLHEELDGFDLLECGSVHVNWSMICLEVISISSIVLSNQTEKNFVAETLLVL